VQFHTLIEQLFMSAITPKIFPWLAQVVTTKAAHKAVAKTTKIAVARKAVVDFSAVNIFSQFFIAIAGWFNTLRFLVFQPGLKRLGGIGLSDDLFLFAVNRND
jgi:hypothetical protein